MIDIKEAKENKRRALEKGKRQYLGKPCKNKEHHVSGGSIRGIGWDKDKKCWKGKSCIKCMKLLHKSHRERNPEYIKNQELKAQKKKNREQAIKEGKHTYRRLKPCKNCGGMENNTYQNTCTACARIRKQKKQESIPLVYLIRNKNKDIIYIGETDQHKSRFFQHKRVSKWLKEFDSLDIILCKDSLTMTVLEDLLISIHNPKYNVRSREASIETQNQLLRTFQPEIRVISRHHIIDEIKRYILE